MPSVLVLNQFALPMNKGGGTRHVELFGQVPGWDAAVLAGSRHYFDQSPVLAEGILETVRVTRYRGNGVDRIVNWLSYCVGAAVRGIRRRPDVVYGSSPHLGAAFVAHLIARRRGVPFVLEIRDLWPQILADAGTLSESSPLYRVLRRLEIYLYRRADAVVALAEGTIPQVVAHGIDEDKVFFVPNGADPANFDVDTPRDALRARHDLSGFAVVYAGAHGPANGLDLALDAAADLAESAEEVHFYLFGDGVSKAGLIESAGARGLANVHFRDPVAKSTIPEIFAAADAGLHCLADVELFKTGVSPNKLYDYMAAGLPAITNTGGETAALVERAGGGLAVGSDQIAAGVRSMIELSPEERAEMGSNGRRYMAEERSRAAMARRIADLLDSVR